MILTADLLNSLDACDTGITLLRAGHCPMPVWENAKNPFGPNWGLKEWTEDEWRAFYASHPSFNVGMLLGKRSGLIDAEIDGSGGEAILVSALGGEMPATLGWNSSRGPHYFFSWDDRLAKWGKTILKFGPNKDLELRLGCADISNPKQIQSVIPPSVADGFRRTWFGEGISPLPKAFFEFLERELAPKRSKRGHRPKSSTSPSNVEKRAIAYLEKIEPAISGQAGHDKTFNAVAKVGPGFDLDPQVAFRLICDHYNPRCEPPWTDKEILHKIEDAYHIFEGDRGWILRAEREPDRALKLRIGPGGNGHAANGHESNGNGTPPENGRLARGPTPPSEPPDDPHRLARAYLARHTFNGHLTLRYWSEEFHRWDGQKWSVAFDREISAELTAIIKREFDAVAEASGSAPKPVTTKLQGNVLLALKSLSLLSTRTALRQPTWIDREPGEDLPDPIEVLPTANSLVHLPGFLDGSHYQQPPTPRFFSPNALSYAFNPDAPEPAQWLSFLRDIWGEDTASIESLQEWFGYLLTPDTTQQKILMVIGPRRSGKGTIGRILRNVVGSENVSAPTLSGLATNFGLAPLIGKTLALTADARLSGRADSQVIVERLLSISGEDAQTIDRKHLSSWTGLLPTRFVLISNELPRLSDASGALPGRMILLRLRKSFFGKEDPNLTGRILNELPGILLWAIRGWARLRERGRFLQPPSGRELLDDLDELSSPVSAFVHERCTLDPQASVPVRELFEEWKTWCRENGRDHPGDAAGFGRLLHAAVPDLSTRQTRRDSKRIREFFGIELQTDYATPAF